jgi:hypothetical protein
MEVLPVSEPVKSVVQPMRREILAPKERAGSTLYSGCTFAPAVIVKAGEVLVVRDGKAWAEPEKPPTAHATLTDRLKAALQTQYDRRYSSWHSGATEDEPEPADMQELKALIRELDGPPADLVTIARQTMAEEYEFLTWVATKAIKPDALSFLGELYTEQTGKPVPAGWRGE